MDSDYNAAASACVSLVTLPAGPGECWPVSAWSSASGRFMLPARGAGVVPMSESAAAMGERGKRRI